MQTLFSKMIVKHPRSSGTSFGLSMRVAELILCLRPYLLYYYFIETLGESVCWMKKYQWLMI